MPALPAEQEMMKVYLGAGTGPGIEVDKVMEENQFLKNRLRLVLAAVRGSPENSPRSSSPLPEQQQDVVSSNGSVDLYKVMQENKLFKDQLQLVLIEERWLKENLDRQLKEASEEQQRERLAYDEEERERQAYAQQHSSPMREGPKIPHSIADHGPHNGDASANRASPFPDGREVGDGVYLIASATSPNLASFPQRSEFSHNAVQVFLNAGDCFEPCMCSLTQGSLFLFEGGFSSYWL